MGKRFCIALVLAAIMLGAVSAVAGSQESPKSAPFNRRHQAGIRLGVWNNLGEKTIAADSNGGTRFAADIKQSSFYFEAYFGFRLMPVAMLELAAGIVNRGDVQFEDQYRIDYGNLVVYPIQLRLKLYPLTAIDKSFQPYLMAGGGLYHGRNNIQISTDVFAQYREDSQTDFNYVLGGGVDWPIASSIGLDLNAAYMPIHFSKQLISTRNYDALTVTVGIKYLFVSPTGDGRDARRR